MFFQSVLHELVKLVQIQIGKKLAGQISDGYSLSFFCAGAFNNHLRQAQRFFIADFFTEKFK